MPSPAVPAAPDEPELPAGHVIGRWRIVRHLGTGGTASVYEARHTELPRRAALKVLHHRYAYSHEMRSRFLREGRAAASLAHPHVVTVHDVGVADDHLFLVMDLLDGEALRDRVRRDGPLPPATLVALFAPIADALAAVHAAGIVHRDVSPANLFVVRDPASAAERLVLLDFSSAHLDEPASDAPLTRSQSLLGTPAYMSPEQCRGARNLDARTDLFSLGAVLFLAATGHAPFSGDTWQSLLVDVLSGKRTPPSHYDPSIPPALEALIERAMAHDPARRFPDALALRDALLALDLRPPRVRRPRLLAALALAALGAVAAAWSSVHPRPRAVLAAPVAASPPRPSPLVQPDALRVEPALPVEAVAPTPPAVVPPLRRAPSRASAHPPRPRAPAPPPALPAPLPAPVAASSSPAPAPLARGTNNALILPHGVP
jgi:tRNA A-37 threonylcarbamoyl transferase component Bud32